MATIAQNCIFSYAVSEERLQHVIYSEVNLNLVEIFIEAMSVTKNLNEFLIRDTR